MAGAGAHTELVLAGLLFSVAVLVTAARVLDVPYPIFLVVGGLGLGLISPASRTSGSSRISCC